MAQFSPHPLLKRKALLGLTLLPLLVTACGGGGTPDSSSPTTPGTTPPVTPPPGDPPPGNPPPVDTGKCAQTISTANITIPTRLVNSAAACDYFVQGYLDITSVLTIDPGTVIAFSQDANVYVGSGGVLNAVGSPAARIKLVGLNKTKGYWDGISFNGARPSRIEYVDIESAGQTGYDKNYAAISGVDGTLSFKNSSISGSYASGMVISEDNRLKISDFANNVFFDNVGYGLRVSATQATILDAGSDYLGSSVGKPNGLPYVKLDWDDVYDDTTIHKLNAPYYVSIALYYKGGLLTIQPGVKIVMESSAAFNLHGGAIRAVGTAAQPIIFTGEKASNGSWDGLDLFYSNSAKNLLDHVQVLYGGGGKGANVYVGNGSYLNIQNSLLAHSSDWGLCLDSIDLGNARARVDIGGGMTYQDNPAGNVNLECE